VLSEGLRYATLADLERAKNASPRGDRLSMKKRWYEKLPDEDIPIIIPGKKEITCEIKPNGGFTFTVNNNLQSGWINPREIGRLIDQFHRRMEGEEE
jgi:hypothetical protein